MKRDQPLLAWQFALYPDGHRDRVNLLLHLVTAPLFIAGTLALALSWLRPLAAAFGAPAILLSIIAQGRGHARERTKPVPFAGPLDVLSRLFVEQWITFPRFILSGAFTRAWRSSQKN